MSPRTVDTIGLGAKVVRTRAKRRQHGFALAKARAARRSGALGMALVSNPLPELGALIMGAPTLGLPIALMTSSIVERMLEKRGVFTENPFPNVAAMERAFGLLNTAPLSPSQETQERILRSMNMREWPAEDFAAWVNAGTGRAAF